MANGRARSGGEQGMNGEFYPGGTFMPSTALPKRGAAARTKPSRKVLVTPGVFDFAPEGKGAVFGRLHSIVPFVDGKAQALADDAGPVAYYFDSPAQMRQLVDLYNSGVLFYDLAPDAQPNDSQA